MRGRPEAERSGAGSNRGEAGRSAGRVARRWIWVGALSVVALLAIEAVAGAAIPAQPTAP